ncbi:SMI1/KNR4 family protein [Nocardia blacklockiae]|uniref:SMI1/KNR4 family protein n=1 Tax=Nocardia blacklockiae TaxID=480036 RepID=UPI001893FBFA|nr:SMI1/KNR4 family protein [Nocardia blacklockiae]MBF6171315.1 SMI1/KNR4 family protein [Nocardia blacklockiae]
MLTTPNPPPDEAQIRAAESRLGINFDSQYEEWLRHANGWKFFSGAHSLFPVESISRDSVAAQNLSAFLQSGEFTPTQLGVDSFDQLVVIGGTDDGAAFIALRATNAPCTESTPVYTFGHGDFEKHDSFKTFLRNEIEVLERRRFQVRTVCIRRNDSPASPSSGTYS